MFLKLTAQVTIIYRADFVKKDPSVYTHSMKTIYLSLVAKANLLPEIRGIYFQSEVDIKLLIWYRENF